VNHAEEAIRLITGDRNESYGTPDQDFSGIAALRADRERLLDILQRWQHMADEWYAEADQYGFGEPNITAGMINDTRAAIDAGLNHIDDSTEKEAQP
jgi:hypothetical protein